MTEPPTKPRRRRLLRFGLRGLMLAVLVIGGVIGWFVYRARVQREAVAAIRRANGSVEDDIHFAVGPQPDRTRRAPPGWLYNALGPDYFGDVVHVNLISDSDLVPSRTDDALMAHIGRLPRLTELRIAGNPSVTGAGLAEIRGLTRLRILVLSGTSIDGPSLVHLRGMTALEELYLPDDVSDADLDHIAGLTSLWRLSLDGPRITDAGLAHLAGLTRINDLTIHCPGVRGPGLAHLRGMTKLDSLVLDGSGVDDLAALPQSDLRILSLRGNPVGDFGAARVANLPGLSFLTLTDTRVGDAGLARLAELAKLQELDLDGTRITDAGLAAFARARASEFGRLDPLGTLDVARTAITDASLPVLRAIRRVGRFDLTGTAVTPAGLAAFKAGLPPWYEVNP